MKGDHVVAGRAALKAYLQRLNDPNQPDDARFEMLVEAPFTSTEEAHERPPLLSGRRVGLFSGREGPCRP